VNATDTSLKAGFGFDAVMSPFALDPSPITMKHGGVRLLVKNAGSRGGDQSPQPDTSPGLGPGRTIQYDFDLWEDRRVRIKILPLLVRYRRAVDALPSKVTTASGTSRNQVIWPLTVAYPKRALTTDTTIISTKAVAFIPRFIRSS
jgi:hypothetical protein